MKTIFHNHSVLLLIILGFSAGLEAQYRTATDDIAGLDLNEVKRQYERAIQRGDSSYTIHYAEALFIKSEFERAFELYQKADRLGLVETKYQQRDYVHAGRRVGEETPYTSDTGYFDHSWDIEANVNAFCSNSPREDFSPFYWKDLLFITSSRSMAERKYEFTQNPFLNIHTFIHDCISADLPDALPEGINTENHDGPIAISADGNLVVITRNYTRKSSDGIYNLYMDYYVREKNQWSEARTFPLADREFSVQHPYFSDQDSLLYFSSNVEGGYGGFDLYKSKWNGSSWEEPENLGPEVNSPYDEVFPAQTPDGTLIYASNHIETTGGLDFVLFRDSTRYLFPEPFNTVHDDFSITFKNETEGYLASNRDIQGFNDDIYTFEIIGPFWPQYDFYVEILDKETKEPLEDVTITFAGEPAEGESLSSEMGLAYLHTGGKEFFDYHFELARYGYQDKEVVSGAFKERENDYVVTLLMEQVEVLARGYFEVYFDNDRPDPRSRNPVTTLDYEETFRAYMLRKDDYYQNSVNTTEELDEFFEDVEQGMEELEWLAGYLESEMEACRNYTIIFTSHASPLASSEYNMILSQRRFVSVENFIQGWENGSLVNFIEENKLDYENNPFGELRAQPGVSADRQDPSRSIYSVEAAQERKVTISWRQNDADESDASLQGRTGETGEQSTGSDSATEQPVSTGKEYHIIIGSFTNSQDAQNELQRLRNRYRANIRLLPRADNGRYRISYGTYANEADAEAALRSIRQNVRSDAWILELE